MANTTTVSKTTPYQILVEKAKELELLYNLSSGVDDHELESLKTLLSSIFVEQ